MNIVDSTLVKATKLIGPECANNLESSLYQFVRRYSPMECVDVVIVPEGKTPSVLLAQRNTQAVAPGHWWIFGGRVDKELRWMRTAQDKVRSEINLKVSIEPQDILGIGRTIFTPDSRERTMRNYTVATSSIVFAKRVPFSKQLIANLAPADGHEPNWKIADKIESTWHPYIQNVVAHAWVRLYGKESVRDMPAEARAVLGNPDYFIPLRFDGF